VSGAAALAITMAGACVVAPPPPPPTLPHPVKVAYFGDSVAYSYAIAATNTAAIQGGELLQVSGSIRLGCALGRYAKFRGDFWNPQGNYNMLCDWSQNYTDGTYSTVGYQSQVGTYQPHLAVVWFCGWDTNELRIPLGGNTWDTEYRTVGDPTYEAFLATELHLMTDQLMSAGARAVVLLTCGTPWDINTGQLRPHAAKVAQLNDFFRSIPASDPRVQVIEAGPFIDSQASPYTFRPDGQHFDWTGGAALANQFLDAQIQQLATTLYGPPAP